MTTPPRAALLLLVPATLSTLPLAAQGSGLWAACNMDSLSTWNCARYYSGTVTLTSELKGADLRQTYHVVATITAGRVLCKVKGSEVGEYEGPGMLAVEHSSNMNAGGYSIDVWCPEEAGTRPTRRDSPLIRVMKQRAADYAVLTGKDPHEHPDADPINGFSGTETIEWALRRQ
jgi:hypothetical protein